MSARKSVSEEDCKTSRRSVGRPRKNSNLTSSSNMVLNSGGGDASMTAAKKDANTTNPAEVTGTNTEKSTNEISLVPNPKKQRGRPRKISIETTEKNSEVSPVSISASKNKVKGNGPNCSDTTIKSNKKRTSEQVSETPGSAKRRGRPPKSLISDNAPDNKNNDFGANELAPTGSKQDPQTKGYSGKMLPETTLMDNDIDKMETPSKKRGRPKANLDVEEHDRTQSDEEMFKTPQSSSRGREMKTDVDKERKNIKNVPEEIETSGKKPGRPPKKKSIDNDVENKEKEITPARRRGRPPKKKADPKDEDEKNEEVAVTRQGRTPKETTNVDSSKDADKNEESITPIRKRGRPAQKKTVHEDGNEGGNTVDASVKQGEKRKKKLSEGLDNSHEDEIETPVRKRGRPPKKKIMDENTDDKNDQNEVIHNSARKKGRPKQKPDGEIDEDDEGETENAGKKQGRLSKRKAGDEDNDESEEIDTPVKKRGRPSKQKHSEADTADDTTHDGVNFDCLRCGEKCGDLNKLKYHLRNEHNALYRTNCPAGDDSMESQKMIMKQQKHLKCQKCGKILNFFQYYKFHIEWCGRENETTTCDLCNVTVKTMHFPRHQKMIHSIGYKYNVSKLQMRKEAETPEKDKDEEEEKEETEYNQSGSVKRRAAKKAMNNMHHLVSGLQTVDSEIDELALSNKRYLEKLKSMYKPPPLSPITPDMLTKWKEQYNKKKTVTCPHKGCNKVCNTFLTLKNHYPNCTFNGLDSHNYTCRVCNVEVMTSTGITAHITSKHGDKLNDFKNKQKKNKGNWESREFLIDSDNSDNDPDVDVADMSQGVLSDDEFGSSGDSEPDSVLSDDVSDDDDIDSVRRDWYGTPQKRKKVCYWSKVSDRLISDVIYKDAFKMTFNYKKLHADSNETPFPLWKPDRELWKKVNQSDVPSYLPVEMESPCFKIVYSEKRQKKEPVVNLPLFGAAVHDCSATLFCGGPIKDLAWCPVQLNQKTTQYLAVSCLREMDEMHSVVKPYEGKGTIQIWECGKLSKRGRSEPKIACIIAHNYGAVNCLSWCQYAWEDPEQEGHLSRLGLLALGCTDGSVRIISVPHPGSLYGDRQAEDSMEKVYSAQESVILLATAAARKNDHGLHPVLGISWHPAHVNLMAASFASGEVAIWNLSTQSSLLLSKDQNNVPVIRPYLNMLVHDRLTKAISWCPHSPHHIATSSHDRLTKVWDLRHPTVALTTVGKPNQPTMAYEMQWSLLWDGVFIANDDAITTKPRFFPISAIDRTAGLEYRSNLSNHSGTVWSINCSDWLNSVLIGDQTGDLLCIILPQMSSIGGSGTMKTWSQDRAMSVHASETALANGKMTIFRTKLECLESEEENLRSEKSTSCDITSAKNLNGVHCSARTEPNPTKSIINGVAEQKSNISPTVNGQHDKTEILKDSIEPGPSCDQRQANPISIQENSTIETTENTCQSSDSRIENDGKPLTEGDANLVTNYKDMKRKWCLVYKDRHMNNIGLDGNQKESKRVLSKDYIGQYPLQAIYKVQWNPNAGAHMWMATGGQAGLVRLHCIPNTGS